MVQAIVCSVRQWAVQPVLKLIYGDQIGQLGAIMSRHSVRSFHALHTCSRHMVRVRTPATSEIESSRHSSEQSRLHRVSVMAAWKQRNCCSEEKGLKNRVGVLVRSKGWGDGESISAPFAQLLIIFYLLRDNDGGTGERQMFTTSTAVRHISTRN